MSSCILHTLYLSESVSRCFIPQFNIYIEDNMQVWYASDITDVMSINQYTSSAWLKCAKCLKKEFGYGRFLIMCYVFLLPCVGCYVYYLRQLQLKDAPYIGYGIQRLRKDLSTLTGICLLIYLCQFFVAVFYVLCYMYCLKKCKLSVKLSL